MLDKFLNLVKINHGTAMLIGGAVIDSIENRPIKDWDIEIYNLSLPMIETILIELGYPCNKVGISFGVIKTVIEGHDIDISIPRTENKIGVGHSDFTIITNPKMTPIEAGLRRDLTINSMYKNLHTGELVDPFNGLSDLQSGILRATNSTTFIEDPLRVLRIMQLLPRKGKTVDTVTIELCRTMVEEFKYLPKERVFEEFKKLLLKSDTPSMGLQFLRNCEWLIHFPELQDLIGCEQNPEWHPEGDVWTHTLMVLDNAAKLRHNIPEKYKLAYMFAALLHDIGKPSTTTPDLRSPGHDIAGVPLALTFMERLTNDNFLLETVPNLVGLHMRAGQLHSSKAKLSAWKRLHIKFRLDILGWLSKADSAGRINRSIDEFHPPSIRCFELCNSFPEEITPIVQGRDLIALGMSPSPEFGIILKEALDYQLDGFSKEEIIQKLQLV